MKIARAIVLASLSLVLSGPVSAAEVLLDWKGNDAGIVIDGPITSETSYQVGWAITEIRERKGELLAYVLNSPGGSVAAALDIASSVRDTGKPVMVLSGSVCASACFLLLAAGRDKAVSQDALIGIHSASSVGVGEDTGAAGAYIAAGLSSAKACDFPSPQFQAGCLKGLHDAPPRGWAETFIRSRTGNRP